MGLIGSWLDSGCIRGLVIVLLVAGLACGEPDDGDSQPTATSTADAASSPTPGPAASPSGGGGSGDSPTAESTPSPATYTVQAGDTLSAICQEQAPGLAPEDCIAQAVALNSLADAGQIAVGQELLLPIAGASQEAELPTPSGVQALVVRVVDGDTIEVDRALDGPATVRLIGVNTPETVAPGQPIECFGPEASAYTKQLLEGQTILLEKDVSETDLFGRLLRYVYLESGEMANELLVRDGYAQVSTFPPDVKYQDRFLAAQQQAVASGAGLWSACDGPEPTATQAQVAAGPTATPDQGSAAACPQGCSSPPEGCVIKGNISQSSGEKIFHVPGGGSYDVTVISPDFGERWFCTEPEAEANGWRKARN